MHLQVINYASKQKIFCTCAFKTLDDSQSNRKNPQKSPSYLNDTLLFYFSLLFLPLQPKKKS